MTATTLTLIVEIDQTISDASLSRVQKAKRLIDLAEQYWQAVFPERGTEADAQLSESEQTARWARVRIEEEPYLRQTPNRQRILEVLDSPATGRPFSWLFPDWSK